MELQSNNVAISLVKKRKFKHRFVIALKLTLNYITNMKINIFSIINSNVTIIILMHLVSPESVGYLVEPAADKAACLSGVYPLTLHIYRLISFFLPFVVVK